MADEDSGIRQHKVMAMGKDIGGGGNFGVRPLSEVNGAGGSMGSHPTQDMPHGTNAKMNHDSDRAGPPHVGRGNGRMPATAHSNHGPHGIKSLAGANG